MRVLDLGCSAVIVPGVQTKEQCEEAVAASLFPKPLAQVGGFDGFRGANPFVRAGRHGLEAPAAYHRSSNEQTLVIPLPETAEALANVEEIMQGCAHATSTAEHAQSSTRAHSVLRWILFLSRHNCPLSYFVPLTGQVFFTSHSRCQSVGAV